MANGFSYYVIDSRYSNPDYIISNIKNSGLLNILDVDMESIDYSLIKLSAEKSYVVQCYEMWKNNTSIEELMHFFHKSKDTIKNYIKRGNIIFRESEVNYG